MTKPCEMPDLRESRDRGADSCADAWLCCSLAASLCEHRTLAGCGDSCAAWLLERSLDQFVAPQHDPDAAAEGSK